MLKNQKQIKKIQVQSLIIQFQSIKKIFRKEEKLTIHGECR